MQVSAYQFLDIVCECLADGGTASDPRSKLRREWQPQARPCASTRLGEAPSRSRRGRAWGWECSKSAEHVRSGNPLFYVFFPDSRLCGSDKQQTVLFIVLGAVSVRCLLPAVVSPFRRQPARCSVRQAILRRELSGNSWQDTITSLFAPSP